MFEAHPDEIRHLGSNVDAGAWSIDLFESLANEFVIPACAHISHGVVEHGEEREDLFLRFHIFTELRARSTELVHDRGQCDLVAGGVSSWCRAVVLTWVMRWAFCSPLHNRMNTAVVPHPPIPSAP